MKLAFQTIPEGDSMQNGFQHVNFHMVFNLKMVDFTSKAHLVVEGHITIKPDVITYSSVVTRETVCIASIMEALHDLEVKVADILNAYVMAQKREKI